MKVHLHREKEFLGVLYVTNQLREIYKSDFSISHENTFQKFENLTQENYRKVSKNHFFELFNFSDAPNISYDTMNRVIEWFTNSEYYMFTKYIEDHAEEIINSKLITNNELATLLKKINYKVNSENTIDDDVRISDIISKKNTSIKIKGSSSIDIKKIDTGENTNINIGGS
ncbi:hypothetical protein [uncultured Kordia sp.]|uniref:hypothetical protein n=1 Tax=uncultured Kordia sp. TaxID=507699 RepID=UPI00262CD2ED|nr:hypothetical protein [uncultured Kordia sp.]